MQAELISGLGRNFSHLVSSTKLRAFSILQGLVVLVVNTGVEQGLAFSVACERLITYTDITASGVLKLSLFYVINSFIIPIVVVATLRNSDALWCVPLKESYSLASCECSSKRASRWFLGLLSVEFFPN
jgi:hypothetical protein